MTVSQIVENKVLSIPTETVFTIKDLGFQSESWENVRVKLARMVNEAEAQENGQRQVLSPLDFYFWRSPSLRRGDCQGFINERREDSRLYYRLFTME